MDLSAKAAAFDAMHAEVLREQTALRVAITAAYRRDEQQAVADLLIRLRNEPGSDIPASSTASRELAHRLVEAVRADRTRASGVDALMHEFSLSSDEGIALMCLAEALLRIPDHHTADRLIADKISKGDWRKHLGASPSLFVNAATWGLLVTGKLVGTNSEHGLGAALSRLIAKGGEPVIRKAVDLAMRMLGNQFVTGQTIHEALANGRDNEARGYRYSYDMLGEAALTEEDALNYYAAYEAAIHAIGQSSNARGVRLGPGISVKLSALHPRYARAQRGRVMRELLPRLKNLLLLAAQYQIGLNIDAEEADRLDLSLDLFEAVALDPDLAGFDGIGFVVQAYQKRCPFVIEYLIELAQRSGHRFMIRLVKGAYWDTEIKRAQVDGLPGYPVFTRKPYTDLSYLVCARQLLAAGELIYPQFATHNAQTLATIHTWTQAQNRQASDHEFQCLHGMGESLYDQVVGPDRLGVACRIYAPVGSHQTLLAYLVRRLLENGANSSFVNQIVDENISIDALLADPVATSASLGGAPHPAIPLPRDLFRSVRMNSAGLDLSSELVLAEIDIALADFGPRQWHASPLLADGRQPGGAALDVCNPANLSEVLGQVIDADVDDVNAALDAAQGYAMDWQAVPAAERASMLIAAADLFEKHRFELLALMIREAGKTLPNALAELREAVDFLRYYASEIVHLPKRLALGPVVCISPWNFPLAIFTGQVSAALAAGNVVLAKPAEQTPLTAYRAVQLLHEAGIPREALQFLPGPGETIGSSLVRDARVRGVVFTGSLEVAQILNRTLAARALQEGLEIPLIAETGGINCMIVDSSALSEQVVQDVIGSAFDSAGQRCSALRVLFLQEEIADKTLRMLRGAMQELRIGNPDRLATDIGPVIDIEAKRNLLAHIDRLKKTAIDFYQLPVTEVAQHGHFVMPAVFEIASLAEMQREIFGPILHVIRFSHDQLRSLVNEINAAGFGLTLGIHTRINETIDQVAEHARIGNIYVNRNMIGAVVGVQPFGGEGKSGTGPKAGGPMYLRRLLRPSASELDDHSRQTQGRVDSPHTTAVKDLARWAAENRQTRVAELAEFYWQTSLLGNSVQLPGPTGERNTLNFSARGDVLCVAGSASGFLNQLAAVLATGNRAVILESARGLLASGLPASVTAAIHLVDSHELAELDIRIGLAESPQAGVLRVELAARDGALVPVIETREGVALPLWRLVAERALCVNTSAAGGNATLMTLGL
ncbi:trifunctional transcriptional regulator/proline dehydrogenase/L-glutamate gamma-semialdehyde dehydrogenase [soil metagenome]